MTLILSGTDGLSDVDGTAATPAIRGTDTNTGIFFPGADRIGFSEGGVQVGEFDASGNFQMNSGYGSVTTVYGCRAWANFSGSANTNLTGTYSQSGTTVTVTATSHGLLVGSGIYSDITSGTGVDGVYTVATVTDANTFTYTAGTSLTTSGNITLRRATLNANGNIASVADLGTGDWYVNFVVAMPDTNYSVSWSASTGAAGSNSWSGGVQTRNAQGFRLATQRSSDLSFLDPSVVNIQVFR